MSRMSKLIIALVSLVAFSLAKEAGELGIKLQSASFQDVPDRKAYLSLFGYINTSPVSAVGLEIGNAQIESEIYRCGFSFCTVDVNYTPIELNLKLKAGGKGPSNFAVGLGGGISFNVLAYDVYMNGIKVAKKNKNLIGFQVFGSGRYFFTPVGTNYNLFVGLELKYQWVDSFMESGGKINLSNTRIGLEFGALF